MAHVWKAWVPAEIKIHRLFDTLVAFFDWVRTILPVWYRFEALG